MARNYFQGGGSDTAALFDIGQQSWDDTDKRINTTLQRRTNIQAGRQYGAGDRTGAARTLAESGNIDAARTLEGDQAKQDEVAYQHGRNTKADERQAAQDRIEHLKHVTGSARGIDASTPDGLAKRKAFILQGLPIVQQETGADMSQMIQMVQQQPPESFDDQNLAMFDGELDKHTGVALGRGGYGDFNQRTGKLRVLREPDKAPPGMMMQDEDGNWVPNQAYVAAKGAVAKATRAPPRARAGSGGGSSLPPNYVPVK